MPTSTLLAQVDIYEKFPLAKNFGSLGEIVTTLLPTALLVGGLIFFVLVIIAGFNFLFTAGSDDAHAKEKWQQILTYGVTGLIIIFAAYWILQLINFITGGALKGLL